MFHQENHKKHKDIEYDLLNNLIEKIHQDYNYLLHDNHNMKILAHMIDLNLEHNLFDK